MMKKTLFALMMALCVTTQAWAALGDANGDGSVDPADITTLIDHLLNGAAVNEANADVDGNGNVDPADITTLIDWLLNGMPEEPQTNELDGQEYVEIGGKKWATMNIGATTIAGNDEVAAPKVGTTTLTGTYYSCYGSYFKWGETAASESVYNGQNYPVLNDCDNETLCAEHDAATVNWGANWHTPTADDFTAMCLDCGAELVDVLGMGTLSMDYIPPVASDTKDTKGVYWCAAGQTAAPEYQVAGLLFVKDATHKLFFPATGTLNNSWLYSGGQYAGYWSSTRFAGGTNYAYDMYFGADFLMPANYDNRYYGQPVRPVAD